MAGILRLVNDGGGSQTQLTASGATDRNIALPDADGVLVVEPTSSGGDPGAYLARNASASAAERTAAGAITFEQATTHEDGIQVITGIQTLGCIETTSRGGGVTGNSIDISPTLGDDFASQVNAFGIRIFPTVTATYDFVCGIRVDPDLSSYTGNVFAHYNAGIGGILPRPTESVSRMSGFLTQAGVTGALNNFGFRSELNTTTNTSGDTNSWNFFAAGTAPNYFRGAIRTGNVTNPGGLEGNGSANESDNNNHRWATQSSESDAVRILDSTILASRYSTTIGNSILHLNRLGSEYGSLVQFREDGVLIDTIALDGSGGITYGTSDYRLKENIVDLPSATDTIKALRPVNFNFKTHPEKTRPGFIAHEVSETLPVAVTGTKDATEAIGTLADHDGTVLETEVTEPLELEYTEEVETEGVATMVTRTRSWTPTGTRPVYQGVDQTKLIPLLTKALQEALERIEALENA